MTEPVGHMPRGYRCSAVHCGIRDDPTRKDLALIISESEAAAAGVFTQSKVAAAAVQVSRRRVPTQQARGVVVCSGNANACTGPQGLEDARRMSTVAAEAIGANADQMLVCSTGVIGRPLPMALVEAGIRQAARELRSEPPVLAEAASAILTTDTRIKLTTRTISLERRPIVVTGLAKGAAMIGPQMATMLAFVLTDASVAPDALDRVLREAVDRSFHCISVEGHTSTNDTVLLFANGAAGGEPLQESSLKAYGDAVAEVCEALARAIVDDAEGISHLITIHVEGLRDAAEGRRVAKAIAESALVKTAIFGADPNWGRIVSAAGYAGVEFEERNLSLWLGDTELYRHGVPQPFDQGKASAYLKSSREVTVRLVFDLGQASCRFWTCDLGYEYIRLNAEYTT
jgi:glutamate N-acetyltransferase/amino-acid N-acetyltransferase